MRARELGEWLTRAREARGLTLEDAERDTRISRRYLQALESGDLEIIPAPVYARGFLRSYAQYLGLDPQEAMARYPREDEGFARPPGMQPPRVRGQAQQPLQPPQQYREPMPVAERPSWQRPGPGSAAAAGAGARPVPMPRADEDEYYEHDEPTIGVDIGIPVPARRLQADPAAQARTMTVALVAIVAVLAILALAFIISRVGGGGDDDSALPGASETVDDASEIATATPTNPPAGASSGVVPFVEGETREDAVAAIEAASLVPNIREEPTDSVSPGIVITQSPSGDTQMSPGDPVTIIVSVAP